MSRQKIRKDVDDLNSTINQFDLIFISRTLYPIAAEYTFFSKAHGKFSKIDHIMAYKTNLVELKRNYTKYVLGPIGIKLEANNRKLFEYIQIFEN